MTLLLRQLRLLDETPPADLRVRRGRLAARGPSLRRRPGERRLDLAGHLAFPGLVNAHDHLSMNLQPWLGSPPYPSMVHFAAAAYRPQEPPLREILRATVRDRLWWGGYKNLVSGVTTVAHHDPFTRRVFHRWFPLRVMRRYAWSHSLAYDPDPRAAFAAAGDGRPFIIHAAEGVDDASYREIDRLEALGVLGPNTVLVHGIALTPRQQEVLVRSGVSLVWCPVSNLRLYGRTAPLEALRGRLPIALGTDATLSGSPTLLDELRAARDTGLATPDELLQMVTTAPARIFRLPDGRGTLRLGAVADLLIVPDRGASAADTLLATRPADLALVLLGGRPRLAAPRLAEELGLGPPNARVDGVAKWLYGDLAELRRRIASTVGGEVLARSPLWTRIEESSARVD